MNSKFLGTSKLVPLPLRLFSSAVFGIFDLLLGFRPLVQYLFSSLASKEAITKILQTVYVNKSAVDAELVEGILAPAADKRAIDVFVKVLTGDPGLAPDDLVPSVACPVKLVWGDTDTITPLNGPYGQYFRSLAAASLQVSLSIINTGHVPMDDDVKAVEREMLPWLVAQERGQDM